MNEMKIYESVFDLSADIKNVIDNHTEYNNMNVKVSYTFSGGGDVYITIFSDKFLNNIVQLVKKHFKINFHYFPDVFKRDEWIHLKQLDIEEQNKRLKIEKFKHITNGLL